MKRLGIALMRFVFLLSAGALFAQEIPLTNWTVPPYTSSSAGGIHTMVDQTPPRAFIGLPPCRLLDTRGAAPLGGGGAFAIDQIRAYTLPGACGIPTGTDAVSLNITATNTGAQAFGHIKVWPVGQTEPNVSTLNYPGAGATIANAAIVPLGTGGAINVKSGNAGADVIIDVNGYFSDTLGTANSFLVISPVAGNGAVSGINTNNGNGTAGVKGVHGTAVPSAPEQVPAGVVGTSSFFDGVLGISIAGSAGVGVRGIRTSGAAGLSSSGELGVASLGGRFFNDVEINGDLFVGTGDTTFGPGNADFGGNVAIDGNLQVAGGTKMFVEPHPTDASKVIRYVSLEGPESGTYFRGRGRFQNGTARIPVPEDFRMVTAEEGLTVQITPIGGMATVGVLRMNLNEIVAQSSRNLEFSYLVQGVRRAFADFQPTGEAGTLYVRQGARSRLGENLPSELKRRLIANGTYNEDGTVNMDTARRLGWDRIWAERDEDESPSVQPNP